MTEYFWLCDQVIAPCIKRQTITFVLWTEEIKAPIDEKREDSWNIFEINVVIQRFLHEYDGWNTALIL